MPIYVPGKLVLRQTYDGHVLDPDANAYLAAVQAADGQLLEPGVRLAVEAFVVGCKTDGIWSAIKASCILAGARTLAGALVPLVGTAPDKYGTEGGWNYNRETGLQGNGTDNYLDSNRANDADPRNNQHFSCYSDGSNPIVASDDAGGTNGMSLITSTNARSRTSTNTLYTATDPFIGMSRASAAAFNIRYNGSTVSSGVASAAPTSSPILVYRLKTFFGVDTYSASRIAFYSIGESLDLTALDARVTDLINAIGVAIP